MEGGPQAPGLPNIEQISDGCLQRGLGIAGVGLAMPRRQVLDLFRLIVPSLRAETAHRVLSDESARGRR
jgi:hypothetical protein